MPTISHEWNLSPSQAIALQKRLAPQVDTQTPLAVEQIRYVAGVDVSVKNNISRAAVVVMRFPELSIVEGVTATLPTPFPYISGLLSFREGAVILQAQAQLRQQPDVYIFDGMGILHPRRLGIAAHLGLWLQKPSIGCGKTPFVGKARAPLGEEKGAWQALYDKDELIGGMLRTRQGVKPVYISVGHLATLDSARSFIMQCLSRYRLPEPIRAAHHLAGGM